MADQVGLLLIAHAPLASALMDCARHVYGRLPVQCAVLDVVATAPPEIELARARELLAGVDRGHGVLVLTDLFGATPSNIASQLQRAGSIEVLTGASLPMLLRTLCYRNDNDLPALVEKASAGAAAGVMRLGSTAPQQQVKGYGPEASGGIDNGNKDANARLHDQQ